MRLQLLKLGLEQIENEEMIVTGTAIYAIA